MKKLFIKRVYKVYNYILIYKLTMEMHGTKVQMLFVVKKMKIVIAICVNHAFLQNCKFCSLDVYDANKHILIDSINTMKFATYNFFYLIFFKSKSRTVK